MAAQDLAGQDPYTDPGRSSPYGTTLGAVIPGTLAFFLVCCLAAAVVKAHRRRQLLEKYEDEQIVDQIVQQQFWIHQTEDQLLDSVGNPFAIERVTVKPTVKEVWKFHHPGHRLEITLEDGRVVGWECL